MAKRYENPVLYNSINQPVDRKTGLIVQQEIPVRQLGRMTQKYDQGFLDYVADRAVAKFYGKKGSRGTAIFLPDRIRFTRKGFRNVLFYREIRVFYKSDPQTFCFVLYVISEKDQKRRYEVYQCDNMEDARRIEDILEASKHSANRLLLDPAPVYNGNYRPNPVTSRHSTKPKEPTSDSPSNLVLECPHCQRFSRVAPETAPSVCETVIDSEQLSVKHFPNETAVVRTKSLDKIDEEDSGSIRIEDRWRHTDYYGYFDQKKAKPSRYQGLRNKWSVWEDDDYEIVERRIRRRAPHSQYGHGIQTKPYHVTSTYGNPTPVNRDPNRQRALYDGKPRLNRQTMQVVEPYVELPQARMRRYRSESDLTNVVYEEVEEKAKVTRTRDNSIRPEEKKTSRVYAEPMQPHRYITVQANNRSTPVSSVNQQHSPITKAKPPAETNIKVIPTESVYVEKDTTVLVKQSNPNNNQGQANMYSERIAISPDLHEVEFIGVNPAPFSAASLKQSKPEITYMKSSVPIEYSLETDTVPRRYVSPTED